MKKTQNKNLITAHNHSIHNERELSTGISCGCFYCLAIFEPTEIKEWICDKTVGNHEERTALCPRCGIDAVIGIASGYSITARFLRKMQKYWFKNKTAK
jgi:hypothetical protein